MLTRRSLLAGSAALAAGCSAPDLPSVPQETELNVAAYTRYAHLVAPLVVGTSFEPSEKKYERAAAALAEDADNPLGPARGGYRLALRFVEDFNPSQNRTAPRNADATAQDSAEEDVSPYDEEQALADFVGVLDSLDADLVTVWPYEARWLGRHGVLLPLERFTGGEDSALQREYYATVLDDFREEGALYALPIGAAPLMLYYDEKHFAAQGVPPPDASWDWGDLVENAAKLTTRGEDGVVTRWGLLTRVESIWWALWQNEAALVDLDAMQCRLQEPAAVAALQFVHDLIHKHRVSPLGSVRDLMNLTLHTPPAMVYRHPPWIRTREGLRMAPLPKGKMHAVPVQAGFGLAIAARTRKAEAAYTALQGFTHAMQNEVTIPASRAAVARLAEIRTDLSQDEVTALQLSLEHGRAWPHDGLRLYTIFTMTESLGRGDDVATIINDACAVIYEFGQTGELPIPRE